MKEYCLVNIPNGDEQFTAICKRKHTMDDVRKKAADIKIELFGYYSFNDLYCSDKTFEDLLTGKSIYPITKGHYNGEESVQRVGCLTYIDKFHNGKANVREISADEALNMIKGMSQDEIDNYIMTLNNLENEAIKKARNQRMAEEMQQEAEREAERELKSIVREKSK